MKLRGANTTRWIRAWGVLDILSMLCDQGWAKRRKLLSQLGDDLRADEILYRCLAIGITEYVYVELVRS